MTINSSAFIKPAFKPRSVHAHGEEIFPATISNISYIAAETIISAFLMRQRIAVQKNLAVAINSVKFKPKPLAEIRFHQCECAAIPADIVRRKTGADGFV